MKDTPFNIGYRMNERFLLSWVSTKFDGNLIFSQINGWTHCSENHTNIFFSWKSCFYMIMSKVKPIFSNGINNFIFIVTTRKLTFVNKNVYSGSFHFLVEGHTQTLTKIEHFVLWKGVYS